MKVHPVCVAVALALSLDSPAALPQPATEADERVDRIVGMAMARGGAHAFLQPPAPSRRNRRLSATEATRLLETLGLESLRRAVYEPGNSR